MNYQPELIKSVARYTIAIIVTGLVVFLPAGTLFYWQGWIYLILLYFPMVLIILYLYKRSPELLKRRLDTKEKKPGQSILAYSFYITIGLIWIISGLDKRYNWSCVPVSVAIFSEFLFLIGYLFLFLVFKENKYLAHTVTVEKGQTVVTTGPYAVVRHPMYASELLMFIFTPMALGSYWGIIPNILLIALLATRIITEENLLLKALKGYSEYIQKIKYRLIPCIW